MLGVGRCWHACSVVGTRQFSEDGAQQTSSLRLFCSVLGIPHVFGPPWFGSICQVLIRGSGSAPKRHGSLHWFWYNPVRFASLMFATAAFAAPERVYTTGEWPASRRVYTTGAWAASGGVYTTGAWVDVSTPQGPELHLDVSTPRGPQLHLEVSTPQGPEWTCLHHRGLSCIWTCLHHRGLSCIWTCLHHGAFAAPGGVFTTEAWATYRRLSYRGLCWSWRCLHLWGLSCIWSLDVSTLEKPVLLDVSEP